MKRFALPSVSAGPLRWTQALARAAADLLYPPTCLGCGNNLPQASREAPLCPACLRAMPRAEPSLFLPRLARFPDGESIAHAEALWVFDDDGILQQVQHALKYGNRPSLGVWLGRLVGERWAHVGAPVPDLIVPVPLHRRRTLERGYNQSERLATGVGASLGVPVRDHLLVRTRPTRSQTALSKSERWQNVCDAFAVADRDAAAGRSLLLVDDVLTTGATAMAAAHTLRDAGADVSLAVLACTRD